MTITQTPAPTAAEFAAAGVVLTDAEYAKITEWKPFCSPAGCVCEKAADCAYCAACTESDRAGDEAYAAYLAEQEEQARPFWEFLYGADEA
jgi:hypothetical protein